MRSLPLIVLFLVGCAAPTSGDDDDSAEEPTPAPTPVHQHFEGTSVYTAPNGTATPAAGVLIHRVLDPNDGSLIEDVYQQDNVGDWDHFTIEGTIDPAAETYTFSFFDGYGTFEGTGTMDAGEAWAWTAWSTRSEYVDGPYVGSYVLSQDTLDDEGLEATKRIFSPDDHAEGDVLEVLAWTDPEAWQAAVDAIQE